ncbi:unnamed protein product [Lepidochelys kempii]
MKTGCGCGRQGGDGPPGLSAQGWVNRPPQRRMHVPQRDPRRPAPALLSAHKGSCEQRPAPQGGPGFKSCGNGGVRGPSPPLPAPAARPRLPPCGPRSLRSARQRGRPVARRRRDPAQPAAGAGLGRAGPAGAAPPGGAMAERAAAQAPEWDAESWCLCSHLLALKKFPLEKPSCKHDHGG